MLSAGSAALVGKPSANGRLLEQSASAQQCSWGRRFLEERKQHFSIPVSVLQATSAQTGRISVRDLMYSS